MPKAKTRDRFSLCLTAFTVTALCLAHSLSASPYEGSKIEALFGGPQDSKSSMLNLTHLAHRRLPCTTAMWLTLKKDFAAVDRMSPTGRAVITAEGIESLHRNYTKSIDWIRVYQGKVYHMGEANQDSVAKRCGCYAIGRMKAMGLEVPDGDFPFMNEDGPYCFPSVPCAAPMIAHTARRGVDFAVRASWPGFYSIDLSIWGYLDASPFEGKKNMALWRGRLTGLGENLDKIGRENELTLDMLTRYRLVKEAESRPELLDAKFIYNSFTFGDTIAPFQKDLFFQSFHWNFGNRMTRLEQAQYRLTVVVDGNYGQGRMAYQMGMKSAILRMKTHWPDTYEEWMVPYEHYVPVDSLEDLWEKIMWLQSNVTEAERIAMNGVAFAQKCLTAEMFIRYFHGVLVEYSARQTTKYPPPPGMHPVPAHKCDCPDFFNGW